MSCNSCKKKKVNTIKKLSINPQYDRLKQAYEYVSIASTMNNEKWDYVEEVMNEIYPQPHPLNRKCPDCLRQMAKLVEYEYNKIKKTIK